MRVPPAGGRHIFQSVAVRADDICSPERLQNEIHTMTSRPAHIRINQAAKTYTSENGEVRTGPFCLEIGQGEVLSLVGPGHCGKTTLLKLIAGLIPASSGEILILETKVQAPQTDIGLVLKDPLLLGWRTVMQNGFVQPKFGVSTSRKARFGQSSPHHSSRPRYSPVKEF